MSLWEKDMWDPRFALSQVILPTISRFTVRVTSSNQPLNYCQVVSNFFCFLWREMSSELLLSRIQIPFPCKTQVKLNLTLQIFSWPRLIYWSFLKSPLVNGYKLQKDNVSLMSDNIVQENKLFPGCWILCWWHSCIQWPILPVFLEGERDPIVKEVIPYENFNGSLTVLSWKSKISIFKLI